MLTVQSFAGLVHKPLGSMALREDFREFIS